VELRWCCRFVVDDSVHRVAGEYGAGKWMAFHNFFTSIRGCSGPATNCTGLPMEFSRSWIVTVKNTLARRTCRISLHEHAFDDVQAVDARDFRVLPPPAGTLIGTIPKETSAGRRNQSRTDPTFVLLFRPGKPIRPQHSESPKSECGTTLGYSRGRSPGRYFLRR